MKTLSDALLYGIVDLGYVKPADLTTRAQQLIDGGVGILQLRAKKQDEADILAWAKQLQPLCKAAGIPFIVNDFPEIALAVQADGVHIGQDDGTLAAVRQIVGEKMIIGRSTHSTEQAQAALAEGFDYIGFGPLFPTPTKKGRPAIGLENIATVEETVGCQIPVFCIGGLKLENLPTVVDHGAKRIVIVSELLLAECPTTAAKEAIAILSTSESGH